MVIKRIITQPVPDKATIAARLGYRDRNPPATVAELIDRQIAAAAKILQPVYAYQFRRLKDLSPPDFSVEGNLSFSSKTVSYVLEGCQKVAVYLATIGKDIDLEIARLISERQTTAGTILDMIGSIAVTQTLNSLRAEVKEAAKGEGLQTTRHFAPGYCDWDIRQLEVLFAAVEAAQLGISLNNGCMMMPQKSVCGIIGIGMINKNRKTPCTLFCEKSNTCEYRNL